MDSQEQLSEPDLTSYIFINFVAKSDRYLLSRSGDTYAGRRRGSHFPEDKVTCELDT